MTVIIIAKISSFLFSKLKIYPKNKSNEISININNESSSIIPIKHKVNIIKELIAFTAKSFNKLNKNSLVFNLFFIKLLLA